MKYNKLVRDKIPEILDTKGVSYEMRIAGDDEYKEELIKKLGEETEEFLVGGDIEESADVLEVVDSLLKLSDYKDVENIQTKKRNERGGFEKKLILSGEKE